jgi:hypothetical protein
MSRDPIERLSDFSPSAEGLDRDALLFEAGRASVPPAGRAWALVALLALTQVMTLLMWPARAPDRPAPAAPPEPPAYPARLDVRHLPEGPPAPVDVVPDAPPLRATDVEVYLSID